MDQQHRPRTSVVPDRLEDPAPIGCCPSPDDPESWSVADHCRDMAWSPRTPGTIRRTGDARREDHGDVVVETEVYVSSSGRRVEVKTAIATRPVEPERVDRLLHGGRILPPLGPLRRRQAAGRVVACRPRGRAGRLATNARRRGSRRATSSRAGPSGDDPHSAEGGGDPPRDPLAYLDRVGPHSAEREFVVREVAFLGHEPEIVSAALTLLAGEGKARRGVGDADTETIWKAGL